MPICLFEVTICLIGVPNCPGAEMSHTGCDAIALSSNQVEVEGAEVSYFSKETDRFQTTILKLKDNIWF